MFNSEKYLIDYKNKGLFPKIHDNIFNSVVSLKLDSNIVDLCCCYGLLAERLNNIGLNTIGIEKNNTYKILSEKYGIKSKIYYLDIINRMPSIMDIIKNHDIKTVVARRCFPELFSKNFKMGRIFIDLAHQFGVQYIILEGRVFSLKTVNPLGKIADEIELCSERYYPVSVIDNVGILKRI